MNFNVAPRRLTQGQGERTASQARVLSSYRLQHNLDLFDTLDTVTLARVETMLRRWKAIGQTIPRRASALVRREVRAKVVLQFVYVSGLHALEDGPLEIDTCFGHWQTRVKGRGAHHSIVDEI